MASREVDAIIAFVKSQGIPYRVTDIDTPKVHSKTSYHYAVGTGGKGLAVDFAAPALGITDRTQLEMGAIFNAFKPMAPRIAELFYAGPGITQVVKNGVWRPWASVLDRTTWLAHRNHVHVAVKQGTFLAQPVVLEVRPMWDPPLHVVDFLPFWAGSGGYMLFADGGIGAVGDAPYREGKQPLGNDYWLGRKPARLERNAPDGYTVVATSGERYEYP